MHLSMTRTALLALPALLSGLLAESVSAEDRTIYPGTSTDRRVAACGIIVSGEDVARIEPFLDGAGDIEGRLELDVTKRSASGQSRSRQAAAFADGRLGTTIVSMNGPAELAIVLSVTDRSGKTLCTMRRSITLGGIALKI
jgi:hypothetical protein